MTFTVSTNNRVKHSEKYFHFVFEKRLASILNFSLIPARQKIESLTIEELNRLIILRKREIRVNQIEKKLNINLLAN